jgi:hypothetical protein
MELEFHGHNDPGMATANSLSATAACAELPVPRHAWFFQSFYLLATTVFSSIICTQGIKMINLTG